jgi:2'-5' RNA ligase
MEHAHNGYGATTLFSLVSYIPGPLGSFLTDLRTELVSSCRLQSHVTVLPPRILSTPPSELIAQLRAKSRKLEPFEVELGELEIFPVTNVIYISISSGFQEMNRLHAALGDGLFAYSEPYPFHPHITLAQEIPLETVQDVYQQSLAKWEAWRGPKRFAVEELVFVRNVNQRGWETLSEHRLNPKSLLRTV